MGNYLVTLLIVVQVLSAIGVIVLVLLQHGKGADMGAAFGGGASGSLFGATGSANFLSRATAGVATVFFVVTLALAYIGTSDRRPASGGGGVMDSMPAPTAPRDIPLPGTPQNTAPAANPGATGSVPPAPASAPASVPAAPAAPATPAGSKPADVPK